nr:hypothetical protein [Tanacetum cinerariifolium]
AKGAGIAGKECGDVVGVVGVVVEWTRVLGMSEDSDGEWCISWKLAEKGGKIGFVFGGKHCVLHSVLKGRQGGG